MEITIIAAIWIIIFGLIVLKYEREWDDIVKFHLKEDGYGKKDI